MSEAVIIGSGIMGLSAALACRRRGIDVTVLEAGDIPNLQSPSLGDTRVFRMAYFEAPEYLPWLRTARQGWLDLEKAAGQTIFQPCGVISLGRPASALISGAKASPASPEPLDPAELARRFPFPCAMPDEEGLFDELGGFVLASTAHAEMLKQCRASNVKFRSRTRVLKAAAGEVETDSGTVRSDLTIVCAGLGLAQLRVEGWAMPIQNTRQVLTYWECANPQALRAGRLPVFAIEEGDGSFFYGFPISDHAPLFKVALHNPGTPLDDSEEAQEPQESDVEPIRKFLARRFPGLGFTFSHAKVCGYDCSPDGHLSVGMASPGLAVLGSMSGHGFKFAPALGDAAVQAALGDQGGIPDAFRASRWLD